MDKSVDIHKAAGIIIRDRRLLVERSKNKEFFIAPGGAVERGETVKQALARELLEEFKIIVREDDLTFFGTFHAIAAGSDTKTLRSDVYMVGVFKNEPTPDSEVEELRWITSDNPEGLKIGSIFEHEVIPRLKAQDLID